MGLEGQEEEEEREGEERDIYAADPQYGAWNDWIPDWIKGQVGGDHWVEVVDGLGAQGVRRAAEDWWNEQVNSKGKKSKKEAKAQAKKPKEGKGSRVR